MYRIPALGNRFIPAIEACSSSSFAPPGEANRPPPESEASTPENSATGYHAIPGRSGFARPSVPRACRESARRSDAGEEDRSSTEARRQRKDRELGTTRLERRQPERQSSQPRRLRSRRCRCYMRLHESDRILVEVWCSMPCGVFPRPAMLVDPLQPITESHALRD